MFWPLILQNNVRITFARTSFKWSNLAANNAGVTVVIVGIGRNPKRMLFSEVDGSSVLSRVENINAYLVAASDVVVEPIAKAPLDRPAMYWGNKPTDGGFLIMTSEESRILIDEDQRAGKFIKNYYGSAEFINGLPRTCIWVSDQERIAAEEIVSLKKRFDEVRMFRASSKAKETRPSANYPHKFRQIQGTPSANTIIVPIHTSENREYLPVGLLSGHSIVSNAAYALYNAPLWNMALVASKLHLVWIATVCGKLETRYRYSNTLGWNTFSVPNLTAQNKTDLTRCAEDILLAREAHFPATIADLYDPETMPADLREAHERNDETLERIYIGRRFKNDTERLEKLFELYTHMTTRQSAAKTPAARKTRAAHA